MRTFRAAYLLTRDELIQDWHMTFPQIKRYVLRRHLNAMMKWNVKR